MWVGNLRHFGHFKGLLQVWLAGVVRPEWHLRRETQWNDGGLQVPSFHFRFTFYSFYSHSKIGVESVSTCIFGSPGPGSCSFAIDDKLHDVSDIDGVRQCTPANLAKWSECSQDPWVRQAPEDSHLQNSTGIEKMTCFSFFFFNMYFQLFSYFRHVPFISPS